LDWTDEYHDDEMWNDVRDLMSTADAVLFGRVTYQLFEDYWPGAGTNPVSPKSEIDFSNWIEKTEKFVFSKTLEKVDWKNATLVHENAAKKVAALKKLSGKNMVVFGSTTLASHLFKEGLIDEHWINVHPVVLGKGKPFLKGLDDRHKLLRVGSKQFESGVVGLRYRKI